MDLRGLKRRGSVWGFCKRARRDASNKEYSLDERNAFFAGWISAIAEHELELRSEEAEAFKRGSDLAEKHLRMLRLENVTVESLLALEMENGVA